MRRLYSSRYLAIRSAQQDDRISFSAKNWDERVAAAEQIARGPGFRRLREAIIELASPQPQDVVIDVGSGTGLLALAFAERCTSVWAIDSSRAMGEYLRVKAASGGLRNVETVHASAESLPLVDGLADIVVSNYCMHELPDEAKLRALEEFKRVLKPGGRLVIGDMMFSLNPLSERDRAIVIGKVRAIAARGVPGMWRLAKNAARLAAGRWESPADADWWREALRRAGFVAVSVTPLSHEGGIARACAPRHEPHGSACSVATPGTVPSAERLDSEELRRLRYPSRNAVVTRSTTPS